MVSNGSETPSENLEGIVSDEEFSPRDWLRRAQEERRNHTITFANTPNSLPTSSSLGVTSSGDASGDITATAISRSDAPANSGDAPVNNDVSNDVSVADGGGASVGVDAPHIPFVSELNQMGTKQGGGSLSASFTPAATVFSNDEKQAHETETPSLLHGKIWRFIWAPELKVFRYILFAYLAFKAIPFIFTVITSLLFQLADPVGGAEVSCYTYNGIHYCDNENPKAIVEKIDSLKTKRKLTTVVNLTPVKNIHRVRFGNMKTHLGELNVIMA